MLQQAQSDEQPPTVLQIRPVIDLDDNQFFQFCRLNSNLRIERDEGGSIIVMAPEGGSSGRATSKLTALFELWSERDGTGQVFSSSTGFRLPNGAIRAPDIAWVRNEQLHAITDEQWEKFPPLCPDFVLERCSPSDSLQVLHRKMEEYIENGARLGWLIHPPSRAVHIYQPGLTVQVLDDPATISGEPLLRRFVLDLQLVWVAMQRRKP